MEQILTIALSAAATLISVLILFNLRSLKDDVKKNGEKTDKHGEDIRQLEQRMAACKVDCTRTNVSKEDWVRSEGFTRGELKGVFNLLSKIEGELAIANKLPEIISSVVTATIKQCGGPSND